MSIRKRLALDEDFDTSGIWWLPDTSDDKCHGRMHFSPLDGIRLELSGTLGDVSDFRKIIEIKGLTPGGLHITLIDCFRSHLGHSAFPGQTTESYGVRIALVSDHHESHSLPYFFEVEIHFDCLEEWAGLRPFVVSGPTNPESDEMTASYRPPSVVRRYIRSAGAEIALGVEADISMMPVRSLDWTAQGILSLRSRRPKSLFRFQRQLRILRQLISFFVGEPIRLRHVTLRGSRYEVIPGQTSRSSTHLLYKQPTHMPAGLNDLGFFMLLPVHLTGTGIWQAVELWFANYSRIQVMISLLLAVQSGEHSGQESKLLALTQAIESYSRGGGSSTYLPPIEYKKIQDPLVAAIPDKLPDDLRDTLENAILYANEHSLRKRMKELFAALDPKAQRQIHPHPKNFIHQVVETRNQITHPDSVTTKMPLEGADLWQSNRRLEVLISHVLMSRIGIPAEVAVAAVNRSRRFMGFNIG